MALLGSYTKKEFVFNFKARTSRGPMETKTSWFIKLWDERAPSIAGIGECGPLPGLSVDYRPDFDDKLADFVSGLADLSADSYGNLGKLVPLEFPSVTFGLECALLDLINGGNRVLFDSSFTNGGRIPINGLIWMGEESFMKKQIDDKIAAGFKCLKLKVGGIDFDQEIDVLRYLRTKYSDHDITIRLDANGAFGESDAKDRLARLSEFDIHSIEQPLAPGTAYMERLTRVSPIPIALDEELIGVVRQQEKVELLRRLQPSFIVLKPTLHGGLRGCREWIDLAEASGVGWWITSALESNVGLNAICQFAAGYFPDIPQGLGTGSLYTNNIGSPLRVRDGFIAYDPHGAWGLGDL